MGGDSVLPKDLPRETNESKRNRAVMVSKLKVGDTLLVRRSNGSYSYSEVQKKSRTTITFTVSAAGDTKVIDLRSAPKHVRLLHEGAGPQMGVRSHRAVHVCSGVTPRQPLFSLPMRVAPSPHRPCGRCVRKRAMVATSTVLCTVNLTTEDFVTKE